MMHVGEKIRKIRDLKGLSQENVADLLGLSLPAYADIERRKKDVTLSRLVTIALKTPTPPYSKYRLGRYGYGWYETPHARGHAVSGRWRWRFR